MAGRKKIDRERQRLENHLAKGKAGLLACYELLEEIRQKVDERQQRLDDHILKIGLKNE